jgi:hypothetical protein
VSLAVCIPSTPIGSMYIRHNFEFTGWRQKGSIFDNHPQNDHVYSNIHIYSNIHKFDILAGASIEYAITSNLAAQVQHLRHFCRANNVTGDISRQPARYFANY